MLSSSWVHENREVLNLSASSYFYRSTTKARATAELKDFQAFNVGRALKVQRNPAAVAFPDTTFSRRTHVFRRQRRVYRVSHAKCSAVIAPLSPIKRQCPKKAAPLQPANRRVGFPKSFSGSERMR